MSISSQTRPRRETVRASVLSAAEAAFLARGYDETTVSEIAATAGFTKGAVYSNFGGKPELLAAVCAAHTETLADSVIAALVRTDSLQHGARALARELTESSTWPRLWVEFRTLATHDPTVRTAYTELRLRLRSDLEGRLRRHAKDLGLRADVDLSVAATLVLAIANGLALEHAAAPETMPPQLVEAALVQLFEGLR